MSAPPAPAAVAPLNATVPFRDALRFWWKLGWISFGGPAGQIATMHQELVERRRWISERRFLHALDYCMVLPGPEAQQLATYIGWLLHGTRGGLVAGGLFVLPAAVLLTALSWIYVSYGRFGAIEGVLFGFRPAVIAVIVAAVVRIGKRSLTSPFSYALAIGAFVALELGVPFPALIATAALVGVIAARLGVPGAKGRSHGAAGGPVAIPGPFVLDDETPAPAHARPSLASALKTTLGCLVAFAAGFVPLLLLPGVHASLVEMALFFTGAAFITFGGAYAVLPYVSHYAVESRGWLTRPQMLDGLALGETTPGPLILVVTFVGYVAATHAAGPSFGVAGAVVATWFTFVPSFFFVLVGAPFVEKARGSAALSAPFAAVTAAVVGVIAHLARDLAPTVFFPGHLDPFPIIVFAAAAFALLKRRLSVPLVVFFAGLAGLAYRTILP